MKSSLFNVALKTMLTILPTKADNFGVIHSLVKIPVSEDDQQVVTYLTRENIKVMEILSWDEKSNKV